MTRMMRSGLRRSATVAVLAGLLAAACTSRVDGVARPDPAVTVAADPTGSFASPTPTSAPSRSASTAPSADSGRQLVCVAVRSITSSATTSVNDYLTVANAVGSVTPELVTAEQKAVAALTPVPNQLRTVPGIAALAPSDALAGELPAIATAVQSVIAAIPLRKSAPFNAATDEYNRQLGAIRSTCAG